VIASGAFGGRLEVVDQAIEQELQRATRDPRNAALRDVVDVAAVVARLECLEVDDGKEQEVVVREQEKVVQVLGERRTSLGVAEVVDVHHQPEHEDGAEYRPELERHAPPARGAAVHQDDRDRHQEAEADTEGKRACE
jgi:hypothetical protein